MQASTATHALHVHGDGIFHVAVLRLLPVPVLRAQATQSFCPMSWCRNLAGVP